MATMDDVTLKVDQYLDAARYLRRIQKYRKNNGAFLPQNIKVSWANRGPPEANEGYNELAELIAKRVEDEIAEVIEKAEKAARARRDRAYAEMKAIIAEQSGETPQADPV